MLYKVQIFSIQRYYNQEQYSPLRLPPIFRKQTAPRFTYAGSSANGMPFRLERNGRSRKTKRACIVQHSILEVNKKEKILWIAQCIRIKQP
jgi:hypothetical protein